MLKLPPDRDEKSVELVWGSRIIDEAGPVVVLIGAKNWLVEGGGFWLFDFAMGVNGASQISVPPGSGSLNCLRKGGLVL